MARTPVSIEVISVMLEAWLDARRSSKQRQRCVRGHRVAARPTGGTVVCRSSSLLLYIDIVLLLQTR